MHPAGSPTETFSAKGSVKQNTTEPGNLLLPLCRVPYPLWKQLLLRQEASLVDIGIVIAVLERSTDIVPAPR